MQKIKLRINRIGKILSIICTLAKVSVIAMIVALCIAMAAVLTGAAPFGEVRELIASNLLFQILQNVADLKSMDPKYVAAIGCMVMIVSFGVLLFYLSRFKTFLKRMVEDESPFTVSAAKQIRRASYALLLMLLYNPALGLILFFVVLLFSYLVEYGAYLQAQADETNRIQEEMIVSFAEITENKSGQTGQHIKRVSEYAKVLALEMGLEEEEAENVRLASTMHDIGKLLIPSEILEKPGRLTDEEYAVIKKHTTYGGDLLNGVEGEVMGLARQIALEHHERADGKGYPAGLTDPQISLEGRIVSVADVYDALTSRRSYKDAWEEQRAYDEIVKGSGTQFDAKVVEAFQRAYPKIQQIRKQYADKA